MDSRYRIADTSQIITPALVVFRELLEDNLRRMIEIAKRPERLRPHCKTHKTREIARMELELGIVKHKCATFAEAEMLASVGIKDIFLAYNLVGPNVRRAVEFVKQFPEVTLSVTADHPRGIASLGEALDTAGCRVDVLLDINVGQHRTGVPVGSHAAELYRQIAATRGLNPGGFHVYDGHQHQLSRDERRVAVLAEFDKVRAFRDNLVASGQTAPRMVCGGTASFPIYAEIDDPTIELSPGTCVLNDVGYSEHFPDLVFPPAAVMLTRVVSRPAADRITLDLGYKAVASDPPAGQRVMFPDLPDAKQVLQNEEHLVLQTSRANEFQPGDELLAIPRHVCPTSALHRAIFVIAGGELVDQWEVASRDRWLTI